MNPNERTIPHYWRRPTILMVMIAAALMFINAARAFADPIGFAAYLGLPIQAGEPSGFVLVYAVRALFIGALAIALLVTRQVRALTWFAATATIMPIGDALLTVQANAAGGTIGRHVAIAVFLLITSHLLSRLDNRIT